MNQIQIPLGMRDTILDECTKKIALKERIEHVFERYGFTEIITPSIEFYQTYQTAFGQVNDQDMYKFFDQDGKILTLRMDMTVPIARVCASKFTNSRPPFRFRYCSNVFKVRQMFAGQRGEVTDCGVELIGSNRDLEVLCCALDTMAGFDVSGYQLEIGNSDFFKLACQDLGLDEEVQIHLADLIDRKSMVELKAYVEDLHVSDSQRDFFISLPMLGGQVDVLSKAMEVSFNEDLKKVVSDLRILYEWLSVLGYAEHVRFDLGKVPHLDYYTGIIFEGFVDGVGHSVLSGGRYDSLLKKFGCDLPACGFSVKLDYLLGVVKAPAKKIVTVCFPETKELAALQVANELRKDACVVMEVWDKDSVEVKQ